MSEVYGNNWERDGAGKGDGEEREGEGRGMGREEKWKNGRVREGDGDIKFFKHFTEKGANQLSVENEYFFL